MVEGINSMGGAGPVGPFPTDPVTFKDTWNNLIFYLDDKSFGLSHVGNDPYPSSAASDRLIISENINKDLNHLCYLYNSDHLTASQMKAMKVLTDNKYAFSGGGTLCNVDPTDHRIFAGNNPHKNEPIWTGQDVSDKNRNILHELALAMNQMTPVIPPRQ